MRSSSRRELYIYLAGFFDGEGTIGAYHRSSSTSTMPALDMTVTSTWQELPDLFCSTFSAGKVYKRGGNRPTHWKDAWEWRVHGSHAEPVLVELQPFLIIKKQQVGYALAIIEEMKRNGNRPRTEAEQLVRQVLAERLNALNGQGRAV